MKTSANGIGFITSIELLRLKPYPDAGKYSIGYGHQIQPGEEALMKGITPEKAVELLTRDLIKAEMAVNKDIKVPLTQNQFDALVSIAYNTGGGSLQGTKLQQLINAKAPAAAIRDSIENHYIHSQGVINPVLIDRRKKEAALFLQGQKKTDGSLV